MAAALNYYSRELSIEKSMSKSRSFEPSSTSFHVDNTDILSRIHGTTKRYTSISNNENNEHSVSQRQMYPDYNQHQSQNSKSNKQYCCGYEHKTEEPPSLTLSHNNNSNHQNDHIPRSKIKRSKRQYTKTNRSHKQNTLKPSAAASSSSSDDESTYNQKHHHLIDGDVDIEDAKKSRRSQSISSDSQLIMEHLTKYRNLSGVLYGKLVKFKGTDINKIRGNKPKQKYVVYVPQKQLLFYSKNDESNDTTTIIKVEGIEINEDEIQSQLMSKYRDKYFKIIGHTRIVIFASTTTQYTHRWYKVINNSLQVNMKMIEPRITLLDQSYTDGWLGKFKGSDNKHIKFRKGPNSKYVIFLPALKILYFCGEQKNKVKTTLVHIRKITRKNKIINNKMPQRYKDSWFKVIGDTRIVLFVAESTVERDIWFNQILKALPHRKYTDDNLI